MGVFPNLELKKYQEANHNEIELCKFDREVAFIVGNPRSGSTLLYQILCSDGKYKCLNNTHYFFYKNINYFDTIDRLISTSKEVNSSKFGYINKINAPSELDRFWRYWFDFHHKYKEPDINLRKVNYIGRNLFSQGEPLLFSWNAHLYYIRYIVNIFSNYRFIIPVRDSFFVYSSWMKAVEQNEYWGQHGLVYNKLNTKSISVKQKIILKLVENDIIISILKRKESANCTFIQYENIENDYKSSFGSTNYDFQSNIKVNRNSELDRTEFLDLYDKSSEAIYNQFSVDDICRIYELK